MYTRGELLAALIISLAASAAFSVAFSALLDWSTDEALTWRTVLQAMLIFVAVAIAAFAVSYRLAY